MRLAALADFQVFFTKASSRFLSVGLVSLVVFLLFAGVCQSATPVALPVTATKASTLAHGKCVGVGKPQPSTRLFVGFKCAASSGGIVWVKVRPDGRKACWSRTSLAAIPPVCLVVPGHG